jgi:hypothetical protein
MFHPSNQTYRGGSYTDVNSLVTNNSLYNTVTTINSSQYPAINRNLEDIKTINTTYTQALSSLAIQISSAMIGYSTQYFSSIHTRAQYEAQLIQYNAAQSTLSTYVGGYNYSTLYYSSMIHNLSTTVNTVNLSQAALEQRYLSVMSAMLAPTIIYQPVYTEGVGYTQVATGFQDKSEYVNIFNSNGIVSALMSIMILENKWHKSTYDGLSAVSTAKAIINQINMSTYKLYSSTFIPSTFKTYSALSTAYVKVLNESNAEDDTISLIRYRHHSTLSTLSSLEASKKIEVEYLQANYPNYRTAIATLAGDDATIKYISAAKLEGATYSLYNSTTTLMQEIEAIYSLTLQGLPIPSELRLAVGVQSGGAGWVPTGIVSPLVCHPLSTVCIANKNFLTKYIDAYNSLSIALPKYSDAFANAKAARIVAQQTTTAEVNALLQDVLSSYDSQLTGALQNITNYQSQIAVAQKELAVIQALYSSPTITISTTAFTPEQLAYLTANVQSGGSQTLTETNKMNAIIINHHDNVVRIPRQTFLPSQISTVYLSELATYTKEFTEFPIKYNALYETLIEKTAALQVAINTSNQNEITNTNIQTRKTELQNQIAVQTEKVSSLKLQADELQAAYTNFNTSIVNFTGDVAGLISQRTIELQKFESESAKYNTIFESELSSEMEFYINTIATFSTSILIDYSSKILNTLNAPVNKPYTISTSVLSTMITCSEACMTYIKNLINEKTYKKIYIDSKKAYDDESSRIISKGTRKYTDAEFQQLKNNYDTYISVVNNCIQYRINQNSIFVSSISTLLPLLEPVTYSYFTQTVQDIPDLGYTTNVVSTSIVAATTPVMNTTNALVMTVDSTTGITYYFNQSDKSIYSMGVTASIATFDNSFVATNVVIKADNGYIYVLEPSRNNLYKIYGGIITNMIGPGIWLCNPKGISNIVNNILYVSCDLPSVKPLLWLDGNNTLNTPALLMDKSGNGYNAILNNSSPTNISFVLATPLTNHGTFVSGRIENKTILPNTVLYIGTFSTGYQVSMDITGKAVTTLNGPIDLNAWNNATISWSGAANNFRLFTSFFTLHFLSDPGIGKIVGNGMPSPMPITGIRGWAWALNQPTLYLCIDGPNYKMVRSDTNIGYSFPNYGSTNYNNLPGDSNVFINVGTNYQLDFTKTYIASIIPTPVTAANTTVFIVYRVPTRNNGKLLSFSNSSSEIASIYAQANGNLLASCNGIASNPISIPQNTTALITTVYTPNAINIGINGATLQPTAGTFSPLSIAQYSIGAVGTIPTSSMYIGAICEVLVYSQELSNNDRKAVEGYLAKKWGVTLPYNSSAGSIISINTVNSAVQTCIGSVNNTALTNPGAITQDSTGSYIYIADGNRIWKTVMSAPFTFVTTLFAGSQTNSAGYLDGVGINTTFNTINDITVDSKNTVYALDSLNSVIRVVTPNGIVNTLSGIAPPYAYTTISSFVNVPVYTSTLVAPIIYSSTITLERQYKTVLKPGGSVTYRFGSSSVMPSTIYTRSNIVAPNSAAWFNNMVNIMYSNNLLYYCNWNSITVLPCFTINTYTLLTIPMSYNLIEPRKNIFSVSYIPDVSPIPTCPPTAVMDSTPVSQPIIIAPTTTAPSIVYGKLTRYIEIMKPNAVTQIGQIKVIDRTGKNVAFGAQLSVVSEVADPNIQYDLNKLASITGVISFPVTTIQAPIQPNTIISQVQSGGQAVNSDFTAPSQSKIKIDLGNDYDVTAIEYIKTNTSYSSSGLQIKTYNSISTISSVQTIGIDLAKTLFDTRSNLLTDAQKLTTPITVLASRKGTCGILGRYVKISAAAGSSAYSFSQITVITNDGTNIALGKRIGTTLNTTNSSVPVTNLINGVYMSLPASQSFTIVSNTSDDYIIIDLGAEYDVAAVNIYYPKTN